MLATLNVPKATQSTTSPFVKADAKTILFPDVIVTSVPLTILVPFKYTSMKFGEYERALPASSFPLTVVGVPDIVNVNLADVPLIAEPAFCHPLDDE